MLLSSLLSDDPVSSAFHGTSTVAAAPRIFSCMAYGIFKILRVTVLEAEGLRNVAVLKKTDSYVTADLVTTSGTREGRTSVKKVGHRLT